MPKSDSYFRPSPHREEAMQALRDGATPEEVVQRFPISLKTAERYKAKVDAELKGEVGKPGPPQPTKPGGDGLKTAPSPEQANVFIIRSQKYEINSLFILIAKHICENEWNWPQMDVSRWLDLYLFHTMRQRGYIIGAYQKVEVSSGRH